MRRKNLIEGDNVEMAYTNIAKAVIDLVKPRDLFLVAGRGTAKSTDIIATRSMDVSEDMPRATSTFIADTYVNLIANVIPAVIEGWERKGYVHGEDFIMDAEPPISWPRSFTKTFEWKRTISMRNGHRFILKSLDRPSANAGVSVQHIFGDEAKYFQEKKLKKAIPTLRGDARLFGNCKYFLGQTYTTDLPSVNDGEHDWIMRMEARTDKKLIKTILLAALEINEMWIEYARAEAKGASNAELLKREQLIQHWERKLVPWRKSASFFMLVSSLVNIDILTIDYLKQMIDTLERTDLMTSVFSIRGAANPSELFYPKLSVHHFFSDGYNYNYFDQYGISDNISQNCLGLKYIDRMLPIELGFDGGNMMSLVVAQLQQNGKKLRILKSMHTIPPLWVEDLAEAFKNYFAPHPFKVIDLYFDRAANQYHKSGNDMAGALKNALEWSNGPNGLRPSGWSVNLKSRDMGTVFHGQEYELAMMLMEGKTVDLPGLLIDENECKTLKASMKLAKMIKKQGKIQKDKKSEKLPVDRLPMESTNMSDAFKALICRPSWLKILERK
jgi:hypothetical protein